MMKMISLRSHSQMVHLRFNNVVLLQSRAYPICFDGTHCVNLRALRLTSHGFFFGVVLKVCSADDSWCSSCKLEAVCEMYGCSGLLCDMYNPAWALLE